MYRTYRNKYKIKERMNRNHTLIIEALNRWLLAVASQSVKHSTGIHQELSSSMKPFIKLSFYKNGVLEERERDGG